MILAPAAYAAPLVDWLGGGLSVTGRRWIAQPCDERMALAIAQAHGLPELAARILAGRGIGLDAVEAHLAPTLRNFLPDPSALAPLVAELGAPAGSTPPNPDCP